MKNKTWIRIAAFVAAIAMPVATTFAVMADTGNGVADAFSKEIRYTSPDINKLTGLGEEPEDISVTANTKYLEKAWYEYVTYSDKAVASYRLSDDYRLLFYDPYTYTNAMVMDVKFDATTTDFDTMSSYMISKTNTKSISACVSSTETNTKATQTSERDNTELTLTHTGDVKTTYNHDQNTTTTGKVTEQDEYHYITKESVDLTIGETLDLHTTTIAKAGTETGLETAIDVGSLTTVEDTFDQEWVVDKVDHNTIYGKDYKTTTTYKGSSTLEDNSTSTTSGWTELGARITKTLGTSRSTSNSWSEEESITISKTYLATHFASDGVTPLPWAIVHYEVQMPMKCVLQVKHSGEWVTISEIYCLLTTVRGTCRAWMQDGQVYYEDWGTGEPVVASDFWGQFLTKEQLMNAYTNKLYPVGGED